MSYADLMPSFYIRNVPDDVHRRLKQKAADLGLSLNAYLLQELEAREQSRALIEKFGGSDKLSFEGFPDSTEEERR